MLWTYQLVFVLNVIIIPEHLVHCRATPHLNVLIEKIQARQIFDSRGNPTVEVDLYTNVHKDQYFRAAVPSGASTGTHEALELRDKVPLEYLGKGVLQAADNINRVLGPALIEKKFNVTDQAAIDRFMLQLDGTDNKAKFGANAILGVSMAACKAGAAAKGVPLYQHIADLAGNRQLILPVPAFNVINGGAHAGNGLAMQEFMILPTGPSVYSFREAMRLGSEVYHHLKKVITKRYGTAATAVGDEGGFAPNIENATEAIELIKEAIESADCVTKISIGMDAAASEFYRNGAYDLNFKDANSNSSTFLKPEQLADLYKSFMTNREYPLVTLEDPFEQDDWPSWQKLMSSTDVQIVGDDLTVTNPKRIQEAINKKAANCLLLKINQIGSITESIEAFNLAKENGWGTMVSHRSGETEDTFIADMAVGLGCGQIKSGAPCRSERMCKYNQLLRIEEATGAKYAGENFRKPWESV